MKTVIPWIGSPVFLFLFVLGFYLDYVFVEHSQPLLSSIFEEIELSWWRWLLIKSTVVAALLPAAIAQASQRKLVIGVSFVFFILPSASYALHYDLPVWFLLGPLIFNWILLLQWNTNRLPTMVLDVKWMKMVAFLCLGITSAAIVFLYLALDAEISLSSLLLQNDIYTTRAQTAAAITPFSAHLFSWTLNLFIPLCIVLFGKFLNRWASLLPFLAAVVLFTFNPHKTILFNATLAILFTWLPQARTQGFTVAAIFVVCLIVGRVESALWPNHVGILEGFLVRRLLFVPAYLNHAYLSFFQEPIFLSHSVLQSLQLSDFTGEPSQVIGAFAYPSTGANANNGIFSDGWMNFGFFGLIAWSVLGGLMVSLLVSLCTWAEMSALLIIALGLLKNSPLLTSLKTHGLAITLLCFFLAAIVLVKAQKPTASLGDGAIE